MEREDGVMRTSFFCDAPGVTRVYKTGQKFSLSFFVSLLFTIENNTDKEVGI